MENKNNSRDGVIDKKQNKFLSVITSISRKTWISLGVGVAITGTFAGLLTAATLADHDIDGVRNFSSVATTFLPEGIEETIIDTPVGSRANFSGYIHQQNTPTLDGAFNEQMVGGVADFIAPGTPLNSAPVFISQNAQANSFLGQYQAMLSSNFRISTVGGFDHIPALRNALTDARFDNYGFVLMDEQLANSRIASGVFRGEQSGFLAGVATSLYLRDNADTYGAGGLRAGTYGGRAFSPVVAFMGGYQQGIDWYNNNVATTASERVELIDLGDFDSFFVGGFESDRAIGITERLLNLGADAIFPVAGVQTREVVRVVNQRDEPAIVVGVDTPMENNSSFQATNNATGRPTIPFSAIKDFRQMTTSVLENIFSRRTGQESIAINGVAGLGWVNVGNFANGLVSVSGAGNQLIQSLTAQQQTNLNEAVNGIRNEFRF